MPIALDDLRKTASYSRRDKRRRITLQLLGTAADLNLAQDFCAYFNELMQSGRTQADFSEQYLTERAGGDFKLARGLISTLLRVYSWECDSFEEHVPQADWERLQALGLENSSTLRLALYDYISQVSNGFVSLHERGESLELFGAGLGLSAAQVDELLFLDSEEQARLKLRTRKDGHSFQAPSGSDVLREYNRMAVETLLFNSSEIVFGFSSLPAALLKRIGYLSKVLRVPYDLDINGLGEVRLRLYGPAEAFGGPTKYGESLATLTFKTLQLAQRLATATDTTTTTISISSYTGPLTPLLNSTKLPNNTKQPSTSDPFEVAATAAKSKSKVNHIVAPAFLSSAEAQVHLRDKVFSFNLLEVLTILDFNKHYEPSETPTNASPKNLVAETKPSYTTGVRTRQAHEADSTFDSSVEAQFYRQFTALEREGQTAGWHLEREPEALAVPSAHLLIIPDFLLTRSNYRVFLEIIGFWTPAYRARKLEKLEKLKQHTDYQMVLATAQELSADFQQTPFPNIFYKNFLQPTAILALLQKEYADFDARLALANQSREFLINKLETESYIAESVLYSLLECYNKTELQGAIKQLGLGSNYVEGYGLCTPTYLKQAGSLLQTSLERSRELRPKVSLEQALSLLTASDFSFDSNRAEALLEHLPGFRVDRLSLFEVFLIPV
jgi:predicted nuclease of restriction endonuclease-like RecB superfamily